MIIEDVVSSLYRLKIMKVNFGNMSNMYSLHPLMVMKEKLVALFTIY